MKPVISQWEWPSRESRCMAFLPFSFISMAEDRWRLRPIIAGIAPTVGTTAIEVRPIAAKQMTCRQEAGKFGQLKQI